MCFFCLYRGRLFRKPDVCLRCPVVILVATCLEFYAVLPAPCRMLSTCVCGKQLGCKFRCPGNLPPLQDYCGALVSSMCVVWVMVACPCGWRHLRHSPLRAVWSRQHQNIDALECVGASGCECQHEEACHICPSTSTAVRCHHLQSSKLFALPEVSSMRLLSTMSGCQYEDAD